MMLHIYNISEDCHYTDKNMKHSNFKIIQYTCETSETKSTSQFIHTRSLATFTAKYKVTSKISTSTYYRPVSNKRHLAMA